MGRKSMNILKWIWNALGFVGLGYIAVKALQWRGIDIESIVIRGLEIALRYLNGVG